MQSLVCFIIIYSYLCTRMKTTIIIERLQSALIAILFITVFLPFGLNHFGWMRWLLLLGIGIIIASSVLLSEIAVEKLLRMPNDITRGSQYIIQRNIRFETINIALSSVLMTIFLDCFANNNVVDNHFSWATVGAVLAVNCWTTVVIHLYWRNVYKKRYLIRQLEEAQLLNGMLKERQRKTPTPDAQVEKAEEQTEDNGRISIAGSTKEWLDIAAEDFLYATSEGNYVRIHYLEDTVAKEMLLRTSMKNAVEKLCCHKGVMQCHRAFIVNLRQVDKVEGRSSGIALVMRHVADNVLVSKQYAASVKERIKNP